MKRKLRPNVKAIQAAEKEYQKILSKLDIDSVEDETLRGIIAAYYLEGRDWTDIGEDFFMHRTTVQKKVQRFFDKGE